MNFILRSYRIYFKLAFLVNRRLASVSAFRLFATPLNQKIRPGETEALQKARQHFTRFGPYRIALYEWPAAAEVPARGRALLVHGWEGNAGSLGAFAERLSAMGYDVLAFDGIAHHKSSGRRTHVLQFSELVQHMLDSYNPEILIAHSFGSAASVLALQRVSLPGVRKMVLLSTPDRIEDVVGDFSRLMHFSPRQDKALKKYIEQKFSMPVEELCISDLARGLKPDVMLVHDTEDRVLPYSNALAVKAKNPSVYLHTIHRAGHYRMAWNEDVIHSVEHYLST